MVRVPRETPVIAIYLPGRTYPKIRERFGDFDEWFAKEITPHRVDIETFDVQKGKYPELSEIDGIIITGSSASVCTEPESWVEPLKQHLERILESEIPTLGVCFGHQILAAASGAKVIPHPLKREIGTTQLHLTKQGMESSLFRDIPRDFYAQETHEDIVSELSANENVRTLAGNDHNEYQALQYRTNAYSVQFHPEITAPIMKEYIEIYGRQGIQDGWLTEEEFDVLYENVAASETGSRLLGNFAEIVKTDRL